MKYVGKLYGKIGNKYFDINKTSKDFDKMEERLKQRDNDIDNLLNVCRDLINRWNGTTSKEPIDLYIPLVDALDKFNDFQPTKKLDDELPIDFIKRRFVTADNIIRFDEQFEGYLTKQLAKIKTP